MSLWRHLSAGVRSLVRGEATDREIADEVAHWLAEATAELEASGLSPSEARRRARLELGDAAGIREEVRSYGWERVLESVATDVRHAGRRLRRSPGFMIVAVLTLALGIGASTAIFSAVNPVLFEPLPYPHAGRIAMISDVAGDGSPLDVTFGTYREVEARSRTFATLAVMKSWRPTVTGPARPARLEGQRVSAGYFRALGVEPVLGREFEATEDRPGGPRVAILSDGLWRRRFGADRRIIGRAITLDGDPYVVVGVMPSGFDNVPAPSARLWSTLQYGASFAPDSREWGHHLRMVGRLRPGVSMEAARRELDAIARARVPEFARVPWASLEGGLLVHSLHEDVTRAVRPALLALLGAVILLLVIGCVNVTNLLLARGAQRRGELAMRAALGARRGRLVRQLLTESVVLAVLGGALGIAVARLGVSALVALSPADLPRLDAIAVDGPALAFALAVSTLVGLLVGLVPALQMSRGRLNVDVQGTSRRTAGEHRRMRGALVVAEVALALVLLVGAGLLLRSLDRLFSVSPGFEASHLLSMQIQTSGHRMEDDGARYRFFTQTLDAVRRVPGVVSAAYTSQLPLSGDFEEYGVRFESSSSDEQSDDSGALLYEVTPDYIRTMGVPLRSGRVFDRGDETATPSPVLVNESFARRAFGEQDPIGRRLHFGPQQRPWDVIVGVVGDVRQSSLAAAPEDAVYVPIHQWSWLHPALSLVVRTRDDAASIAPAIERAIWAVDKDQPVARVMTMDALRERSEAQRHFALVVFETFALLALALAAIGIYGVLSGSVSERSHELGVRSALGASRERIIAVVIRQGLALTALGIAIGLAAAVLASRVISGMLFGVSRLDVLTYAAVVALLVAVATLACTLPALRAARVDPASAIRA